MTRPTTRKLPAHRGVFSYARIPLADGAIAYRLFRRDMKRRIHFKFLTFDKWTRSEMAWQLNTARHQLRDSVDAIDLEIMGVMQ